VNLFDTIGLVSDRLTQLNVEHAFIGGSVIPFLIDDPNIVEFRPTKALRKSPNWRLPKIESSRGPGS